MLRHSIDDYVLFVTKSYLRQTLLLMIYYHNTT